MALKLLLVIRYAISKIYVIGISCAVVQVAIAVTYNGVVWTGWVYSCSDPLTLFLYCRVQLDVV